MRLSRKFEFVAILILVIAILAPRLPGLDAFGTVDEATWLMRSGNFYYALGQRDFENTVYAYHPAVTTMWVGAVALMLDFPEYRGYGQGYFEKEWQFIEFIEEYDYPPLDMLKTSRLITVVLNTGLFGLIYWLLRKLLNWFPASVGVLFLSFSPYLLGHTRILAHEGMMSLLLLVSILAMLNYLYRGYQWIYLIMSAIAAGLAVLTKSSATIIIPFLVLLCLADSIKEVRKQSHRSKAIKLQQGKRVGGTLIIWSVIFSITYFAFWPGMWVNPGKMLTEVYGNAFSYAVQGSNLESVESDRNAYLSLSESDFLKYAHDFIWRTTPIIWIGLIAAFLIMLTDKNRWPPDAKPVIYTLLGFGLIFYIMMSIVRGRDASHYIMATFASFSLIAGLGIGLGVLGIQDRFPVKTQWVVLVSLCLIALHAVNALSYFPYYFNYSNPLLEQIQEGIQTPVSGYGEGLELAAEYIAKKPASDQMTAMSWWGIGPFSFFFPGQTKNIFPNPEWSTVMAERLADSDYLVIYYYHQVKRDSPAKLLRDLAGVDPIHTIWIKGVESVRIYKVSDLPDTVFVPDSQDKP